MFLGGGGLLCLQGKVQSSSPVRLYTETALRFCQLTGRNYKCEDMLAQHPGPTMHQKAGAM